MFIGNNTKLYLCFDGVFANWIFRSLAKFLHRHSVGISYTQSLAQCAGLLGSQVNRLVLLAMVQLAKIFLGLLIHDNVDACDGFTHDTAEIGNKIQIICKLDRWRRSTHIFESFDGAPPVTLATRSPRSSCFKSSSCLVSSFLSF